MWPFEKSLRNDRASRFVDERLDALRVVHVPRNKDVQLVGKGDQAPIDHPVRGPGKCDAIAQDIRTVGFHRANVRGMDFGTAAAVDQLQSGDRASLVVGFEDKAAEKAISDDSRRELGDAITLLLKNKGGLMLVRKARRRIDHFRLTDSRQLRLPFIESQRENAIEITRRDRPYSGLRPSGDAAVVIQHPAFNHPFGTVPQLVRREPRLPSRAQSEAARAKTHLAAPSPSVPANSGRPN